MNTVIDAPTSPILSMLCMLALLPLAESVPPSSLAAALAAARVVEPAAVGGAGCRQPKVAAFARRWAGLVLTRRNDYVLKFDYM